MKTAAMKRNENLDVVRTSRDQESVDPKGSAGNSAPAPHLSVVCPYPALPTKQRKQRGRYRARGTNYISISHATNIIQAVDYARAINLRLIAHATIHWSGTVAFDDHDGTRFVKVREGLSKVLLRRGIPPAWVWCRECKARTDVVHCHLLFHLPTEYRTEAKLKEIEGHLVRLVDRHGDGILGEFAVKLKPWPDPDGLYLIKGGGQKVWRRFRIPKKWRETQGFIAGKRCGTSQNIGPAARRNSQQGRDLRQPPGGVGG